MWLLLSRYLLFCQFFLNLQVIISSMSLINSSSSPSPKLCSPEDSSALLLFKNSFTTNSSCFCIELFTRCYPKTESWKEGSDCCSWDGVTCDPLTGHVIGLDLAFSRLRGTLHPNSSLFFLRHLQSLTLTCNDFIQSKISPNFSQFTKLTNLSLYHSNFGGSIPASFWKLTGITFLSLASNNFSGQIPASLSNLRNLSILYLYANSFSGVFPDVFANLSKLTDLSISRNNFSGQLPSSIFNLTGLSTVHLSFNHFEGRFPSQVSGLQHLTDLDLADNLINGRIPSWVFSQPSLEYLDLSNNKIYGSLPNSTNEIMPLLHIDLSSNNLSGVISPEMFSKLKSLMYVDLSFNIRLSIKAHNSVNITLPNLGSFKMSFCNVTEFPIFFRSESLKVLNLSNNKISGQISKWELKQLPNLLSLDLSHNFLTSIEEIPIMSLESLDLRSNLLENLMELPSWIQVASFSNNRLIGEIPSSFCNINGLAILDLSNNGLSGTIPECLLSIAALSFLDLRMNNFHGSIPRTCPPYNALAILNLNGNQLQGPLPPSLVNCSGLEVLDVGNNKINDTFPHWLGVLSELQVLILRSNKFHGSIHESGTGITFPELRILDLSHNRFNGLLPTSMFNNFEAMMHGNNNSIKREFNQKGSYYQYSVVLTVKGVDVEMTRTLTIFTAIDLSSNQFRGQIPEIVGKLNSLIVLNFSLNNLTGHIPSSLKNLTQLESLDLSSNKLGDKIPTQLTSLTFLSVLNLSYNQLVGSIPQGNQFETFQNDSYIGNLGLCGLPLSKQCSKPKPTPKTFHEELHTSSWFNWKVIMMGYGSGLVIGLSMGYFVFSTRKPWWFVRLVESGVLKIERRMNGRRRGRRN